jgi:glyoxylase-like metal-dependent hydrolase (beta-lactamase superfamily II)
VLVGDVEVTPVLDAVGAFGEVREMYPDVPAADWAPYRELYPGLFAGESFRPQCNAYLVRSSGTTVLVDTGIGPPGLWDDFAPEREGLLPSVLEQLGVERGDVDLVFLTHLHIDHLGWNADADGVPFFPGARYLAHAAAVEYASSFPDRPHIRRCVLSLGDRLERVAGDVELAPGVVAFETPGHYPGHMSVRIRSGGAEAVVLGDVSLHPALLDRPEWVFVHDDDAAENESTRRALLAELVDRDVVAICGHYPGTGIGRVITRDGRVIWEPESAVS